MFKKKRKMVLIIILGVFVSIIFAPRFIIVRAANKRTYDLKSVPESQAAVVFGAGLNRDGTPTAVLRDRVKTAHLLYQAGKVKKVLMSGDNRFIDYNEPGAMKAYAVEIGIPEEDIVQDYAGRRTYDTCYRAKAIFQLSEVILVTQEFHLPRALYTCNTLGLESWGVAADLRNYRDSGYWNIRETIASLVAFIQVHITRPEPVLGDLEPIFPME